MFEESLKKLLFLPKREIPKVCTFCPTLSPIYPLKLAEIGKNKNSRQKFSHRAIQIYQPQPRSSSSFQTKNTITFCTF